MFPAPGQPRKVALTIGNNKYQDCPLTNCVNDATDLGNKLKEVGFLALSKIDLNSEQMDRELDGFVEFIKPGDFVLFFYAGHGVQWEDQNYLVPCGTNQITDKVDLKYRAINAQRLLERLSTKKPFVIIFLLDCCRNYWVPNAARSRAIVDSPRGLAEMFAPSGSVIGFACAPGKTAGDTSSNNRNGIYTRHLLKHIATPGEEILLSLIDVTKGVEKETKGAQEPYTSYALKKRGIWLVPPKETESNASSTKALKHSSKSLVPTPSPTPHLHSPNLTPHRPAPITLSVSTSHPPPHTIRLTPIPQGEKSETSLSSYPPSTPLVAPSNPTPTPLVVPSNPPPNPLVAPSHPPPNSLVAPSYPHPNPFLAPSYLPPNPLVARSYPPPTPLVEPSYYPPTTLVDPSYYPPTPQVDPSYYPPNNLVFPSPSPFNFIPQPDPLNFSPLLHPHHHHHHHSLAFPHLLHSHPHHHHHHHQHHTM